MRVRLYSAESAGSAERFAAAFGKSRALRALIAAGANVNAGERQFSKNTPLHWAACARCARSANL